MKRETISAEEYKTPKCKVVGIHSQKVVCGSLYGAQGAAGADVTVENDDYEY